MRRRFWRAGGWFVIGCWLAAGCGSVPESGSPAPGKRSANAARSAKAAARSFERAVEAHARYAAAVIQEMNGETQLAEEGYYQAALQDPGDDTLTLAVSERFLRRQQTQRALEVMLRAAEQPDASGRVYARLGEIYVRLDKPAEAEAASRVAIRKAPGTIAGYRNLVQLCMARQQPEAALKVLDEAARQTGVGADFLVTLAEMYAGVGLKAAALKDEANAAARGLLNRAAQTGALTPLLRLKLADGYLLLGDAERAAEFYLEVLKRPPDLPLVQERVRANLTSIYLRGSDHPRASEQLRAILRDDPTNPQAYYYLGRLALEDRQPAEAVEALSKAILLSPDIESAYYYLAVAQMEVAKPGEALATLEKARQRFAQSFAMEFYTALAYNRQKDYAQAVRHFIVAEVIAKATDPGHLNEGFYFQLGAACERNGDYAQAEKYFQQCLQLAPDFAEALNYLGYMWAERGEKLSAARELIERAVKAEPRNAAFLDSLAWVLFKLGQPGEALPHALRAVELSEQPDATLFDHLGDIYHALREPDKARAAWRQSLAVEPSAEVRQKLEANTPP